MPGFSYFAKFSAEILDGFWASYDAWDVDQILGELGRLGITPMNTSSSLHSLSDLPSPILFRLMSNWAAFADARVQKILQSFPPNTVFEDWPTSVIPPGMLVFFMEQTSTTRQWASTQASRYISPLSVANFTDGHIHALEAISRCLVSRDPPSVISENMPFRFAVDIFDLWAGFATALRFIPVEYLKSTDKCKVDVRRLVSGHLSDTGTREYSGIDFQNDLLNHAPDFAEVLRCFNFLLKRLEASFWTDEPPEYPLVVFDTVKNNAAFERLIQNNSSHEKSWHLAWVHEYFHCTQKIEQIYGSIVAKIFDFLLEELQHERFGEVRPHIFQSAIRVSSKQASSASWLILAPAFLVYSLRGSSQT